MNSFVFNMPRLHSGFAGQMAPECVAFFPCGLPEQHKTAGPEAEARAAVAASLPLRPFEAAAALAEMLSMGEAYAADGLLHQLAIGGSLVGPADAGKATPGEMQDLAAFAVSGAIPDPGAATVQTALWRPALLQTPEALPPALRQSLIDCQKVLLLAYAFEERMADMATLEVRCRAAEQALLASLAEGESDVPAFMTEGLFSEDNTRSEAEVPLSWRVVMEAAAPFLPDGAALFTSDAVMTRDLAESGLLQAVPESECEQHRGFPPDLRARLVMARHPVWRLAGRKRCPDERPWLEREVTIFVDEAPGSGVES